MQACVEVWESDPEAYAYQPVGYMALGPEVQESDLAATFERQERIGYRSEFIVGEAEVDRHMKELFPDWRAKGVTACLHEHQGGFAFNLDSVRGLAGKCESEGVQRGLRRRGDRSRVRLRRLGDRASRRPKAGWRSASSSSSRRGRGRSTSGRSSTFRRPSTSARPTATWSRTARCGRTGTSRRARSRSTRSVRDRGRRAAARHPPRHRRPAHDRRGRARDGRALGHLLQARPPRRPGRRLPARGGRGDRARPLPVDHRRRPGASRTCGARPSHTP